MANTLKFGNGEWYGKKDTILAYNDENNNYKPLPFSFERASSATVVNKAGLIETVGSGEPRIDYKDDANGALKLEPTRTNYWIYSEGSDITLNSPLGEFGFHTINNTFLNRAITYVGTINLTFIIKKIDGTIPIITTSAGSGDLVVLVNGSSVAGVAGVLTDIGNGFYKYELTRESSGASVARIANQSGLDTYVSLIQYEDSSYPTSYIPTQGSAVTRLADACNNGGNEQVFNSLEGVLYINTATLTQLGGNRWISIHDNTGNNDIELRYTSNTNQIRCKYVIGSVAIADVFFTVTDATQFSKIAFKWASADFALWIDGVEVATSLTGATSNIAFDELSFDASNLGSTNFYGKVKDVRVYNTALTDNELQKLTTI